MRCRSMAPAWPAVRSRDPKETSRHPPLSVVGQTHRETLAQRARSPRAHQGVAPPHAARWSRARRPRERGERTERDRTRAASCPGAPDADRQGSSGSARHRTGARGGRRRVRLRQPRRIAVLQREPRCVARAGTAVPPDHDGAARGAVAAGRSLCRPVPSLAAIRRRGILRVARRLLSRPRVDVVPGRLLSGRPPAADCQQGLGHRQTDPGADSRRRPGGTRRDQRAPRPIRQHHGGDRRGGRQRSIRCGRCRVVVAGRRGAVRVCRRRGPPSAAAFDRHRDARRRRVRRDPPADRGGVVDRAAGDPRRGRLLHLHPRVHACADRASRR